LHPSLAPSAGLAKIALKTSISNRTFLIFHLRSSNEESLTPSIVKPGAREPVSAC